MDKIVQIWHNKSCSKSTVASQWLRDKGIEIQYFEYLNEGIQFSDLESVIQKLQIHAFDLIRKNESNFDSNWQKNERSEKEWIELMIEHPNLIQRPIIIKGEKAIVARPLEIIEILF